MSDCLTFDQYCAFDCNRNMVVTAGPGAGKTRVLTERFCHIMLTRNDLSIGEILTLTFTEKAAEEMKARIYLKLSNVLHELRRTQGTHSPITKRIKENLDDFSKNRISTIHSFCARLLREYPVEARVDPGFSIVQGLTQREMMMKAIRSAITSVYKKDKGELTRLMRIFGSRGLLLEAVRAVIEHPMTFKRILATKDHLFNKDSWKDQVLREYCKYLRDDILIPYYEELEQVEDGKGQYDQLMDLLAEWYQNKRSRCDDLGIPDLFAQLRGLAGQRRSKSTRLTVKQGKRETSYLDLVDTYYPDLFAASNPDNIFEQELSVFLRLAMASLDCYEAEKRGINAYDFADLEARTLEFLSDLFFSENQSPIRRLQNRFKYIMVDEFQDTNQNQWEILSLIASDRDRGGRPVLREDKLFVVGDKRQAIYRFRGADVTVFDRVTEEIKHSNASNTRPMLWHDQHTLKEMTSIAPSLKEELYGHKALCEALSVEQKEKIRKGDIELTVNFRSDGELIQFFNATFSPIFGNKQAGAREAYESSYLHINGANVSDGRKERGSAVFYLIPQGKSALLKATGYSKTEREAFLLVDIIGKILGRDGEEAPEYRRYGSIRESIEKGEPAIGILFFAFTHIKTFETILREAGIPFVVNRGKGFFRCEEIVEMVQLLDYLSDERQTIPLLAALRSPILGLTDPEIFDLFTEPSSFEEKLLSSPHEYVRAIGCQLCTWRRLVAHLSLPQLIRTITRDRGLTAVLTSHPNGVQRMANVEKFIGIARQFEAEGNGCLSDFVGYCRRMADEEDEEGEATPELARGVPIHLMTIHASKGLEFPMVIIPELDRSVPRGGKPGKPVRLYTTHPSRPEAWNDREGIIPIFDVEFPLVGFRKVASPLSFLLGRRDFLEDVAENRRVFYVGCTRAMRHLILTGHRKVEKTEQGATFLTSRDYREGATILDLLDDIWGLSHSYRQEMVGSYPQEETCPLVVWSEPGPRRFAGVTLSETKLKANDFPRKDDRVKELDLTRGLDSPSFHLLSPTSLVVFKRCPLRFYYRYWLNIPEYPLSSRNEDPGEDFIEEKGEWGSFETRVIGILVHAYLERHVFGSEIDEDLLSSLFSRFLGHDRERMLFDRAVIERIMTRSRELLATTVKDQALIGLLGGVGQYSEVPFILNRGRGHSFRGRVDKLFKETRGEEWSILDWKTASLDDENPIIFSKDHFLDLQLACYRLAVEELKYAKVGSTYLYFNAAGKLVEVDYTGDATDEIDSLIEFIEGRRANSVEFRDRVRKTKRSEGVCSECAYFHMELC